MVLKLDLTQFLKLLHSFKEVATLKLKKLSGVTLCHVKNSVCLSTSRARIFALLRRFARVWARASAIARLSWHRLVIFREARPRDLKFTTRHFFRDFTNHAIFFGEFTFTPLFSRFHLSRPLFPRFAITTTSNFTIHDQKSQFTNLAIAGWRGLNELCLFD